MTITEGIEGELSHAFLRFFGHARHHSLALIVQFFKMLHIHTRFSLSSFVRSMWNASSGSSIREEALMWMNRKSDIVFGKVCLTTTRFAEQVLDTGAL